MRIETLLQGLTIEWPESLPKDTEITGVVYDSRKVVPGCLFLCLKGAQVDGHRFAAQAAEAGAAVILAEHPVDCPAPVVVVPDTRYALAVVSAAWFWHPAK